LLTRLWRDWLRPHAGTLAVVLVLIAVIGAATGF
jgi:subfamily B ATP-binding cassette protein MsbA